MHADLVINAAAGAYPYSVSALRSHAVTPIQMLVWADCASEAESLMRDAWCLRPEDSVVATFDMAVYQTMTAECAAASEINGAHGTYPYAVRVLRSTAPDASTVTVWADAPDEAERLARDALGLRPEDQVEASFDQARYERAGAEGRFGPIGD
jgi:hypothetical protein